MMVLRLNDGREIVGSRIGLLPEAILFKAPDGEEFEVRLDEIPDELVGCFPDSARAQLLALQARVIAESAELSASARAIVASVGEFHEDTKAALAELAENVRELIGELNTARADNAELRAELDVLRDAEGNR